MAVRGGGVAADRLPCTQGFAQHATQRAAHLRQVGIVTPHPNETSLHSEHNVRELCHHTRNLLHVPLHDCKIGRVVVRWALVGGD